MENEKNTIIVRDATLDDVESIYNLIKPYVEKGDLLPRSKDDIADHIRNFIVAEHNNQVIGCMAIKFYSKELVEFRTLVVNEKYQGMGVGRKLVERGIEIVRGMGVKKVFVLTRMEKFFQKVGFQTVKKEVFPEKVWFDCMLCPKLNTCDEIAMVRNIS